MNLTPEQLRCARHGEGDLIISAAAGSGKTAVLTARIAELVKSRRAGIDEMLVVTFTRAAALELTHRVRARLLEAQGEAEGEDAAYLARQAELIGGAYIGTVHAFCARVLRRHFAQAELDPAFRVVDETQSGALMLEAAEEALEQAALEGGEDFLALFDRYGGRDGQALLELTQRLYAFTRSQRDAQGWLKKALGAYDAPEGGEALKSLMDEARRLIGRAKALTALARGELNPGESAIAALDDDLMKYNSLLRSCEKGSDELKRHLDDHEFITLRFSKDAGEDQREKVKRLRESAKGHIKDLAALFPLTLEEELGALFHTRPAVSALIELLERFGELYDEKKAARGVVDFGDLEHRTLLALREDSVANEYLRRFRYVFMDEYQDTNRVQDAIIERVSRGNLFLVGDVKQSIYRFRLADPELFMERYERSGEEYRARLPHNFRSSKNVIDAVNGIFEKVMTRSMGGVDYSGEHALTAARKDAGPMAELHLFDSSARDDDDELESAEREAMFAAQRIRSLVGKPLRPGGEPLKYSDCAVLLRSTREAALTFARRFALEGVPVRADAIGGIFGALEVQVFRNLLRVIDNRRLDVPLLSVMRSPLFAFTDAELATIRLGKGETVFDDVLAAALGEGGLSGKCRGLLGSLESWKLSARLLPVDELIDELLAQTGYLNVVSALPGGEQRAANLLALREHARAAAPKSLWAFLGFLESIERSKRSLPGKAAGNLDAVRIMSVHRSKGLEFPLVVVAGLGKRFNLKDINGSVQIGPLGVAMRCVKPNEGIAYDTLMKSAFKVHEKRETLSEEMRILYVALTRARDALMMIGSARNLDARMERAKTDNPFDAGAPVDWLMQAHSVHEEAAPFSVTLHGALPRAGELTHAAEEAFGRFRERAAAAMTDDIERVFSFKYPYERAAQVPSKLSVSELSKGEELVLSPPAFLAEPTHADVGTLAHDVLMRIDLKGPCDEAAVLAVLSGMEAAMTAHKETLGRVDSKAIAAFLNSQLGMRLRASERIERETRFQLFVPADMLMEGFEGESALLQGVIDCCFIENGAWILIDYKTDYIPDGDYALAAQKHERQLTLYAYALKRLTGKPVSRGYIHFLRYGQSVPLI